MNSNYINSPQHRTTTDEVTLGKARRLWELSFDDDREFLDLYFGTLVEADEVYLLEQADAEAIGHIHADKYALHLYPTLGREVQGYATYISGACTHPSHRGKGIMQALMEAVLEEEAKRGRLIAILIPADEALRTYYRVHFGFETHSYATTTEDETLAIEATYTPITTDIPMPPSRLLTEGERGAGIVGVWHSEEDWQGIIAQYEHSAGAWVATLPAHADAQAVALGRTTEERIYLDALSGGEEDKKRLIEIIKAEYPERPITYTLPEYNESNTSSLPRGMVRPINCPRLMDLYAAAHPEEEFVFSLVDWLIEGNTGLYKVQNGVCEFYAQEIDDDYLMTLADFVQRFVPTLSMPLMND